MANFNLLTITFIVTFSFLVAAFILFWVSLRRFLRHYNYQPLLFGIGFAIIAASNLSIFLINSFHITTWLMFFYVLGFSLILLSLITENWQYSFALAVFIPLVFSSESLWHPLAFIFFLPVSYLSLFNFCKASSACDFCTSQSNKEKEGKEWALIFFLLILSLALFNLSNFNVFANKELLLYAAIFTELAAVFGIFYHILKCVSFSRGEKTLLPLMTGFVIVVITIGYFTNTLVSAYMEKIITSSVKEEVNAVKEIVLLSYEKGKFIEMVKTKDENLNEFLDEIYAKTGIRSTIFLENERVAASLSATGKGRLIGTKIEDANVKEEVLEKGNEYTGKVEKGGELTIAAYTPIYEEDEVIGMIGTGKLLTPLYELYDRILLRTVAGVAVVMILVFSITYYTLPRRG